ncbi:MAG: GAF domain-containing protein [Chloroflexota bacterium]
MDNTTRRPEEETAKFKKAPSGTNESIRQLSTRVNDLVDLLRAQRDILRGRGMDLPSGALDNLKNLKLQLDKLGQQLGGTMVELSQLRALADTAGVVNSSLDPTEVLNRVMDTVIQLTGAERGYIVLKNRDTGEMEYRVARGIDREQLGKTDFVVSGSIVNEVANTGVPVLTGNAQEDKRFDGRESIVNFQLRSILAVPLKVRDEVIGVVYCDNRIMVQLFKQHELNLLIAFANQAAVAIENARLFADLTFQLAQVTEARDLMSNIFASITSGVLTLNGDSIVTECNPAAELILGKARHDVVGKLLDESLPSFNGTFHETLQRVKGVGTRELLEVESSMNGEPHYWNMIMSPLLDSGHEGQGVAIVLDDLTAMRKAETQLGIGRIYSKIDLEKIRNVNEFDEREISVLHSDVRGFTTFSEQLEPEELMTIINQYLSLSSDAVNLYDGIVDKYMGDAVTGLYNTQFNPQENHAERAVRAAMSMMYDLFALHEVLPEEQRLFYGIGVHTGAAVLGNVGSQDRKEFAALGDAMDLAKLLQENALGGEVLLSQATFDLVQHIYHCEPVEPRKTKDRTDFTVMYKVLKLKKRTGMLDLDNLNF